MFFPVKTGRKGQVMLEVVAAVGIVSVALTVIIASLVGNYRAAVLAREYTRALLLIENYGQRLYLSGADVHAGQLLPCSGPQDRFRCTAVVTKLSLPGQTSLRAAEAKVAWDSGKKERDLTMTMFIAGN